jgi:hypothetical protein
MSKVTTTQGSKCYSEASQVFDFVTHESLENLTPADIYFGKVEEVLTRREEIKRKTMRQRCSQNLQPVHV